LEKCQWKVWLPDLPKADEPNVERYNKFLFKNDDWQFNSDSILIGHSSGAVAIFGLLQVLPDEVQVDTCYLVGAFKDDLGWDPLKSLNDPYCPLDHAKYLA